MVISHVSQPRSSPTTSRMCGFRALTTQANVINKAEYATNTHCDEEELKDFPTRYRRVRATLDDYYRAPLLPIRSFSDDDRRITILSSSKFRVHSLEYCNKY